MRLGGWRSAVAAAVALLCAGAAARATETGAVVPFFTAADLQGTPVSLGELVARRRVAVLFWDWRRATSNRALQALDRLQRTYAQQGFEVVAVEGEGSPAEQVAERVEKLRGIGNALGFAIVPDPGGRIARQFGIAGTPEVFVLDGAGRVFFHLLGFRAEDEALLEERVKERLGLASAPAAKAEPAAAAAGEQVPGTAAAPRADAPAATVIPAPDSKGALLEKYRYFGNFHLNRGEAAKAEDYFRKYLALAPDDVEIWLRLGESCARQRRYDEAREAWEAALKIEPRNAEADANIRRLIRGEYGR
jgi:tetratricopeptide (TPR) repeat protein